jgi:glycosyltransferase involved in cell wall biosynthesis
MPANIASRFLSCNMRKKILIITNLYPSPWEPNRATFNKQQFEHLSEHADVSILVPVAWTDWLKLPKKHKQATVGQQGVTVRYCWSFYTPKVMRRLYSVFMLVSLLLNSLGWIKQQKADVLMASWAYPEGVASAMLAKILGIPFFIKVHGSDINDYTNDKARAKQIVWACKKAQGIFSVSQALKEKLMSLGVSADKIHVIYNGVNKQLFFPNAAIKKAHSLLYVGNLKASKGVGELLAAFIKLKKTHKNLELVIAGAGEMMPEIISTLAQEKLSAEVKLLGSVNHQDIALLIQQASILVLPSYAEGVPNVILEAMSCGTPVVATNVGGIPEIVSEHSGVLVAPKDINALTQGLSLALAKKWQFAEIVKQTVTFSWENNAVELYQHLQIKDV